jgi:SRSO17 transposase
MTPVQLARVRARLEAFAAELFAPLARIDQRRKGLAYLRGLLLDGRRKSIQPMAARLGEPGVNDQALQQFVSQSTWDWASVRQRLAARITAVIAPVAWIIDDTGFPKFGRDSPGVARQYSGTLGKVGNCQLGVSVHAATDQASCPLDWRLFLPEGWDDDAERRRKARIPATERHRPKWQLALDMLDELGRWELAPPVVVADAGYGESGAFRLGLEQREHRYVVQVKGATAAYGETVVPQRVPYAGRGRRPAARYRAPRCSLRALTLQAAQTAAKTVAWREGSRPRRRLRSRFVALRVRPAGVRLRRAAQGGELPVRWLLAEWPPGEAEPVKYWLANLPADTSLQQLVGLAKLRWRIEHDYRELKDGLGLDHFEGRSWPGWHRHVTLVSVAHAFVTLQRLDPKAAAPA